jgi:uncharacterized protein DUF3592
MTRIGNIDSRSSSRGTGCGFVLFGFLFAILGIYGVMERTTFLRRAISANGTVVSCDYVGRGSSYQPTVRFATRTDQQIISPVESASCNEGEVGKIIQVKYDPNYPQDVRVDDGSTGLVVLVWVGALLTLIGLIPMLYALIHWYLAPFRS